jgi:drug/metabolite transporter (DMT)-like permease
VTFLIPVFGVLYGALLLGEAISAWMVVCALVIVVGTALASGVVKLSRR